MGVSSSRLDAFPCTLGSWVEPGEAAPAEVGSSPVRPVRLKQVHGAAVWSAKAALNCGGPAEGDGLVSDDPQLRLEIVTADCVPVLIANAKGNAVAALHAGWRGQVSGIAAATLERLGALAGPSDSPSGWKAWIGPHLSPEYFEVGEEVAEQFTDVDLDACIRRDLGPKPHIDLAHATTLQLQRFGVRSIEVAGRCTWEQPQLPSYRRDVTHGGMARTGRLVSWIRAAAPAPL